MATTNTAEIISIQESNLDVGDNGSITVQAGSAATPNTNVASGTTVAGTATITADTKAQVALLDSTVDIGSAGTLSVTEISTTSATGTSVDGIATVVAEYTGATGGIIDIATTPLTDEINVGAGGVVGVTVDNTATAASTSIAADSSATADFGAGSFGILDSDVSAGVGGNINVNIDANVAATANTIGPVAGFADADANATFTGAVAGIFASTAGAADIKIGEAGTISALAGVTSDPLNLSATAVTVTGDATADATATTIAGIGSDPGVGDTNIDIGTVGNITAAAVVNSVSSATTVSGDPAGTAGAAAANNEIATLAGLGTGLGAVNVGTDATITAVASSTSAATAVSTDGAGKNTTANVDTDAVFGINTTTLEVGNDASLSATVASTQTASATTVSAVGATTDEAKATVGNADAIVGIETTLVDVGRDASKLSAAATLTGSATSSNINGFDASSEAGLASQVFGIFGDDGTKGGVTVGGNLTGANGLRADAVATLTATATNVAGTADADAGDATSLVAGINAAPVDIGRDGNITTVAGSTVTATATTTGDDATADAIQTASGLLDSDVTIGRNGSLIGQASLAGTATTTTVGPIGGTTDATSTLTLDSSGISQTKEAIEIGDTGNVTGSAFTNGSSISTTVNGNAASNGTITAQGLELLDTTSNVTVGGTGNVTGLGVIGTLNSSGNLAGQVQLTSTAVSEDATSTGKFDVAGIFGTDTTDATVTAGPRDGDIVGQAFGGANLVATTTGVIGTGGDAKSDNTANLYGIADVNLVGGMVGQGTGTPNAVRGTSFGDFDLAATSVNGDAEGVSTVNAYGIFNTDPTTPNTLDVNGGVTAIATLSNTVTANTVAGAATATATSNVVGISGYDINIIAGGTLTASTSSNASAIANSVGGNV
ncbi:MAG: hypothetical protein VKJ44_09030 [Synechococcus sp.]|nr:hypothetical protein [Synechococcus sp.]